MISFTKTIYEEMLLTMNTAATYVARALSQTSPWAIDAQRKRAVQLLLAGTVGAFLVALPCIAGCTVMLGRIGLLSSFVAAAVVIVFFTMGQAVQIAIVDVELKQAFFATLIPYLIRATGLGYGLQRAMALVDSGVLHANSLVVTLLAVMLGWLIAEITVFQKLRFPLYDSEYFPESQRTAGNE